MKKIGIFASGNGTNFKALAESDEINSLADIEILVCDNPKAKVLARADKLAIKTFVFNPKDYENKKTYEKEILKRVKNLDFIFLAGYMRILSKEFLENFEGQIINIHPSLLPKYKGTQAIKRAYDNKDDCIGVSIHYVSEEVDGGKIIAQYKFKVDYDLSLSEIEEKVHELEHKLYVETAVKILKGEM